MIRLNAVLASLCLVVLSALPGESAAAAYGYEKWADELGIDVNASYSGRRVVTSSQGTMEFKEHHAPQKTYMEFEQQGVKGGVILRQDLDKAYVLMFPMNMYRETSISEASKQAGSEPEVSDVKRVGRGSVNGVEATEYQATFKDEEGSGEGSVWVSDSGIPLRWHMTYNSPGQQGETLDMVLHDLEEGEQPGNIFEVPGNMSPMGSLGGLLGGFGGGNKDGEPPSEEEQQRAGNKLRDALEQMRKRMNQ